MKAWKKIFKTIKDLSSELLLFLFGFAAFVLIALAI